MKKVVKAGMKVDTVIGDAAYSEKGNIQNTQMKMNIKLVAKLNPSVTQGYTNKRR